MELELLLAQLANLKQEALETWADLQREEDEDFELDEDYVLWLTLEEAWPHWECGYRVRPDEATEWTLVADGPTPMTAAQALLTKIKK